VLWTWHGFAEFRSRIVASRPGEKQKQTRLEKPYQLPNHLLRFFARHLPLFFRITPQHTGNNSSGESSMCNDTTTAVRSHSLGSTLLVLAWSFIGLRWRRHFGQHAAALDRVPVLAAALAGAAVLLLGLLAVFAILIICLPAIVHLVVE
jgi:hypothetical protein